jgi:hypothetical protein
MGDLDTGYLEYFKQSTYLGEQLESRDYQHEILINIHTNQNSIIATARQMGKTITVSKYIDWYSSIFENRNILILGSGSHHLSTIQNQLVPISANSKSVNKINLRNETKINFLIQKSMNLYRCRHNDLIWIDEPMFDLATIDELRYHNPTAKIIITGGSTREFIKFYNSKESSFQKTKITWDRLHRPANYLEIMKSFMSEDTFYSEIGLGYLI